MYTHLPIISSAGYFHSSNKFSDPSKYPEASITKLRTVVDYEIELFSQDGGVSHINGKSYPIKKGSLLIAQPGDKRQSTLHFAALFMHFGTSDKAIQELIHSMSGFHSNLDYEKWESEFRDICEMALHFEQNSDIHAAAKLIDFLCKIKQHCLTNSAANPDPSGYSAISMAIEYMKQTYMEPTTVNRIAEHCCVSTSYLHKLFLGIVHTTPNNYLLNIRLSKAKALLATTSIPISEVAARSGFNSQAYFSDCFKRQFDISPKEFRKAYLKKLPC